MPRTAFLLSLMLLLCGCASVISATTGDEGVEENRGRRSVGAVIDDGSIETAIKVNLNAADPALKSSHINVVSYNGVVLMVGQVPSQDLKNLATRTARASSSRIKDVYNELEVSGPTSFLSRSNDAWLSTKLKTMMVADPNISGMSIKLVTENGVVYMMGLVSQQEANDAVDMVSTTSGVTKVVRAFELID